MENSHAPRDISLKNIIDKLAEFVARNGPEFEQMTKIKQKGNPKFSFLYNGEYHNYYLQKVASERNVLGHSQQSQGQQQLHSPQMQVWNNQHQQPLPNPAITAQLDALTVQQNTLREQITVSEQNLQAQHGVLLAQQQAQIEDAIARAQVDYMNRMAHENNVNLVELDQILQPIVEQCTKDSISNGANEEQSEKLSKLLALWESKANFFDSCAISKLKSPPSSLQEYKNSLRTQHANVITPLTLATKATFDNYQQQHQAFIQHAHNQIAIHEQQKQQIEQQNKSSEIPQLMSGNMLLNQQNNRNDNNQMGGMYSQQMQGTNYSDRGPPPQQSYMNLPDTSQSSQMRADFSLPPPTLPDLSRPPPGFGAGSISPPNMEQNDEDLTPSMPYFELPAGLIVPLIRLEDYKYHALDADMIRLPPPTPPNERLLSAVEAFYSAPSHERPRDGEGWEKLALYEYFKVKNAAKKQKEEEIQKGNRDRSKSPTPIPEELCKKPVKKAKKRVYRSKSRSNSRSISRSISPDLRPNIDNRSRRRSKTPPRMQPNNSPQRRNLNREKNEIIRRERSITPPSFSLGTANKNAANEFIQESNKGHQMLMKMGWRTGTGLGSQGQGIDAPIQGGKVRDQNSKFQGIGLNAADPYENFRKSRGQAFITRMKARSGEERS